MPYSRLSEILENYDNIPTENLCLEHTEQEGWCIIEEPFTTDKKEVIEKIYREIDYLDPSEVEQIYARLEHLFGHSLPHIKESIETLRQEEFDTCMTLIHRQGVHKFAVQFNADSVRNASVRNEVVQLLTYEDCHTVSAHIKQYGIADASDRADIARIAMQKDPLETLLKLENYDLTKEQLNNILREFSTQGYIGEHIARYGHLLHHLDEQQRYRLLLILAVECPHVVQTHLESYDLNVNHKGDIERITDDALRELHPLER